jgi:hypothetical protein
MYFGLSINGRILIEGKLTQPQGISVEGISKEYPLYKYQMENYQWYYEAVQCASGPHFFLALKDEGGEWVEDSLWPDNETAIYL